MAHSLYDVRTNLAAKYAPGTLATPTGAQAIRASFARTPASVPAFPAVYVEIDDGEIVMGSGEWQVTHNAIVNFLLSKAPGDPARVDEQRDRWLVALLQATFADADISTTGVKSAYPAKYEYAEIQVAGELWDGIRIFVPVMVREAVSLSA